MSKVRHLSWENFSTSVFVQGERRLHHVGGPPVVDIFADGETNRIGIWVECPAGSDISADLQRLAAVKVQYVSADGRQLLEVATSSRKLFRSFYLFAVAVADGILQDGITPLEAVRLELQNLAALLEATPLLGLERQLGLLGELIVLEKVIRRVGPSALSAWIGPRGEPHDFRLHTRELEVKTTTGTRRIHTINGTQQLIPTPGHKLFLVSVLLGPPGSDAGFSLAAQIDAIRQLLSAVPPRNTEFETLLEACGYRPADHELYSRCFIIRRPLAVAHIDDSFPSLTSDTLAAALGEKAVRIEGVQYEVNIEGLEHEDGSPSFRAALGSE
jgi:hypothetical protein